MQTHNTAIFVAIVVSVAAGGVAGFMLAGNPQENSATQTLDQYPVELSMAGMHRHDAREAGGKATPSVEISAERDPMMPGHVNVHIMTENVTFAPENVSGKHVPGEGHAHVFVDGVKISRAYGQWYHIPRLKPGKHTIRVTLNTNAHEEYTVDGEVVAATDTVTISSDAYSSSDDGHDQGTDDSHAH